MIRFLLILFCAGSAFGQAFLFNDPALGPQAMQGASFSYPTATMYVSQSGNNSNGRSWANAYTTMATAEAAGEHWIWRGDASDHRRPDRLVGAGHKRLFHRGLSKVCEAFILLQFGPRIAASSARVQSHSSEPIAQ